ncbi:hypothetical protein EZJ49_08515 [Bdellovibrio bacteriovorus]|uniref:hypothetical protein n=1 Tax=Bdellovibrio bacteriovorus TaxID=959 RepID=UPI0021CFACEB|nr:hypothetical protein [Bdellovibrio bacteriovorus]UXR63117.1 hypothetical protein EZJ49_08515 [Bdellovibrio bacteriovorus]
MNLRLRQPTKGAAVQRMAQEKKQHQAVRLGLKRANTSAESLDHQITRYLEVSSMGRLQRWQKGIDLDLVKVEYSQRVLGHLRSMTHLMKMRRSFGNKFSKLYEFDFQNLMRKSDYVLAVNTTRTALEYASAQNGELAIQAEKVLAEYNQERLNFDAKMIAFNN